MIQLTAHTTQAFTYFRHRVAAAQYPKKHRNKMRHATEGLVIMVTLLLADDAFDIDSGDYFHKLFQNRLSDKIYFPIFTHVVVFSQNKLTTSGGGPYKAYPLFYFIRSVVIFYIYHMPTTAPSLLFRRISVGLPPIKWKTITIKTIPI